MALGLAQSLIEMSTGNLTWFFMRGAHSDEMMGLYSAVISLIGPSRSVLLCLNSTQVKFKVKVTLRPTVSQPVNQSVSQTVSQCVLNSSPFWFSWPDLW
jgi:hypothetical protein